MSEYQKIFKRYVHCRSEYLFFTDSCHKSKDPPVPLTNEKIKELTPTQIGDCLKDFLTQYPDDNRTWKYPELRKNEFFKAINEIIKSRENAEERHEIYQLLPKFMPKFDDLALFLSIFRENKKPGFGGGMRRMVKAWYNARTEEEIVNEFMAHRSAHGISHRDIFNLCHFSRTEIAASAPMEFLFTRTGKFDPPEASGATENLVRVCRLKTTKNVEWAVKEITENKFPLEVLPTHLLNKARIWEECYIRQFDIKTLFEHILTLRDLRLLSPDSRLTTSVCEVLRDERKLRQSTLHPLEYFMMYKLFEHNRRHTSKIKDDFHAQKLARYNIQPNQEILSALLHAFEQSFNYVPKSKYTYCITIDNRKAASAKAILSPHKSLVSVFDASLIMALTLLKSSTQSAVFTFGDNGVIPLLLMPQFTYLEALECCKKTEKLVTHHKVGQVFRLASEQQIKADIFYIFSDSIARCSPQGQLPIEDINNYAQRTEVQPKVILFGLSRKQRDLKVEDTRVFECAGFTKNTLKVVDRFINGEFN